jgi:hypothetical protein
MHTSTLTRPQSETPQQHSELGDVTSGETGLGYNEIAVEYAKQARKMYEAGPQMSVLGLIRLIWSVIRTRTAPKTFKL